jgi:hypothetical protein
MKVKTKKHAPLKRRQRTIPSGDGWGQAELKGREGQRNNDSAQECGRLPLSRAAFTADLEDPGVGDDLSEADGEPGDEPGGKGADSGIISKRGDCSDHAIGTECRCEEGHDENFLRSKAHSTSIGLLIPEANAVLRTAVNFRSIYHYTREISRVRR